MGGSEATAMVGEGAERREGGKRRARMAIREDESKGVRKRTDVPSWMARKTAKSTVRRGWREGWVEMSRSQGW